jgi:hypothetical protein
MTSVLHFEVDGALVFGSRMVDAVFPSGTAFAVPPKVIPSVRQESGTIPAGSDDPLFIAKQARAVITRRENDGVRVAALKRGNQFGNSHGVLRSPS